MLHYVCPDGLSLLDSPAPARRTRRGARALALAYLAEGYCTVRIITAHAEPEIWSAPDEVQP